MGVVGSFKRPFVSYKHHWYKQKGLTKTFEKDGKEVTEIDLPKVGQRVHKLDFRPWELAIHIKHLLKEEPLGEHTHFNEFKINEIAL